MTQIERINKAKRYLCSMAVIIHDFNDRCESARMQNMHSRKLIEFMETKLKEDGIYYPEMSKANETVIPMTISEKRNYVMDGEEYPILKEESRRIDGA